MLPQLLKNVKTEKTLETLELFCVSSVCSSIFATS